MLLAHRIIKHVLALKLEKCSNTIKRGKSLFIQGLLRYYKFKFFAVYFSTASWAATNKGWISVYYVKFGKYLGNILNIFCVFCTNTSCLRKFLIILKCYRQCKRAHSKQIKRDVNKTHSACFPCKVNDYFWNKASLPP